MNENELSPANSEQIDDDVRIARAFRGSLIALLILASIAGLAAYLATRPDAAPPIKESKLASVSIREESRVEIPTVQFSDVTQQLGINFVHNNGATGKKLLPETMGGGVAVFDFDNDSDQDILFVNSSDWPWDTQSERSSSSALYENRDGEFVDVTEDSGLDVTLYGMGASIGDYDNDGDRDVFITAVGKNYLFENKGNGKFEDVSQRAGVAGDEKQWSSGSGWFDYDNDGDLDLFVCNYLQWNRDYDLSQNFQLVGGGRAYGRPQNFEGTFPYLYQNQGDGTFNDISESAGVQIRNPATDVPLAKSLGVTFADLDADGYSDILVANDTVQNLLFRGTDEGKFQEFGVLSGIAFDSGGNARGAMGIDVSPLRDGRSMAVAIGNFANEMTALYVARQGELQFFDEAVSTGLGPTTRLELTFGIFYFDYDLDGRLDLFCSNGHLEEDINRVQPSQHYAQPPQLFWNAGPSADTEFVKLDVQSCGSELVKPMVGRGATYFDFDRDGDLDVVVAAVGDKPRLLRNENDLGNHWIRFKLIGNGISCNRDAIGSWVDVTIKLPDETTQTLSRQVMPTRSYQSQVELPVTMGLGKIDTVENVAVRWSDGQVQSLGVLDVDQVHVLTQPKH